MATSLPVIANAHSHSGGNAEDALRDALREAGIDAELHMVDDPAKLDATIKDALASSPRCIIAAGGDGTVNAVAGHALKADVPLAVLPAGTLNHFAGDLGVPDALLDAARVLASGQERRVDVGTVNGRIFLNNASIGLYAAMVERRERLQRHHGMGKWTAMARAGWQVLRHPRAFSVVLHCDGRELHRTTPFVFVGNNDYALQGPGAGARASLDDGVLSVYVLRPKTFVGLLGLAVRALLGRVSDRDLDAIQTTRVIVGARGRQERVARDGEVEMLDGPIEFKVLPGALRVLAPREGG